MAREKVLKRVAPPLPTSIQEVADLLGKIGYHQRQIIIIQAHTTEKMEKIRVGAIETAQPHEEAVEQLFEAIYTFAQANRLELTDGGKKKTVVLPTGDLFWRTNPPSVAIRDVEKVIALCEEKGLSRFVRIKKEPDKEAMLKEPEVAGEIRGVTIKRDIEEFGASPAETQIEVAKKTKGLRKK